MKYVKYIVLVLTLFFSCSLLAQRATAGQGETTVAQSKNFEFYVNSAGEIYFFNILGSDDYSEDDEGNSVDYTGRQYKMEYAFDPVYMISFSSYARWRFLTMDGAYKTDRFWSGGGTIETDDDADVTQLTDNKAVSEILQFGVEAFNLRTSYKKVNFDFGSAKVLDAETEDVVESQDLTLGIREFDIIYSFAILPVIDAGTGRVTSTRDIYIGYKNVSYSLPRIVYKMEDINSSDDESDWRYVSETAPQEIKLNMHMIGAGSEYLVHRTNNLIEPIYTGSLYLGLAQTSFDFDATDEEEAEEVDASFFCVLFKISPGLSFKTTKGVINSSFRIMYDVNLMFAQGGDNDESETEDGNPLMYDFAALDVYHGVKFGFDAYF